MTESTGRVAWISIAPVKAMALVPLESARLETTGIAGDRAFAVLDPDERLVNGKRLGPMARIRPDYDPVGRTLALHFPDGSVASGPIELGTPYVAPFRTRPRPVRTVSGPWSEAISAWAKQPLHLVALAEPGDGADRGPSATFVSTAALLALAQAGGADEPLDQRRFRMTFGIDGVDAYLEDGWVGREVRIGEAVVKVDGNVGRCAVTTQDPDTGHPNFDTLHVLNETRGALDTTEPLPFGVWSDVVEPGLVRIGDRVEPVDC
jgi:MOSC domain-containing protein